MVVLQLLLHPQLYTLVVHVAHRTTTLARHNQLVLLHLVLPQRMPLLVTTDIPLKANLTDYLLARPIYPLLLLLDPYRFVISD